MNLKWKILLILDVLVIILSAYVIVSVIWPYFEIARYNQDVGVINNASLHNPIDLGIEFDFCGEVTENSDPVAQLNAGTKVPYEPVLISTEVVFMTPSFVESESTPMPNLSEPPSPLSTPDPSPTPTSITPPQGWDDKPLKVVRAENYSDENYHIVFVPVGYGDNGYGDAYFLSALPKLIESLNTNFSGVKVDFAYADSSVEIEFKHVRQSVDFKNDSDKNKLFGIVKKVYPADGIVVLINTPATLGTKGDNYAILSGSDLYTNDIATHEIAHLFGLDDGYQLIFGEGYLPNTELFYADKMPLKVVKALEKMEEWPTIYKVGNCKGREVYTFYESNNNIMMTYATSEIKSWGTSTFTPLQIILMNDYILWFKGQN